MVQVSIVICAHNPRPDYLSRVIAALRNQVLPYNQWELVIVDNASEPPLAPHWNISWHPHARHIRENELGLAAARRRGMAEATADLLAFVDDDNVLAENYLSEVVRIAQEWPALGTWGSGTVVPEFERQPADYLKPYLVCLALRDNRQAYWSNVISYGDALPNGAGMCLRASVANEYRRLHDAETIRLTGRKGTALVGHEDTEIAFVGCSLGFGMGVFPELRITHLIPKERVSDEYLLRLAEGNQISGGLLEYKWLGTKPPNPFGVKGILSMFKNVVLTGGFHRRHYIAQVRGRTRALRALAKYRAAKGI